VNDEERELLKEIRNITLMSSAVSPCSGSCNKKKFFKKQVVEESFTLKLWNNFDTLMRTATLGIFDHVIDYEQPKKISTNDTESELIHQWLSDISLAQRN